MRCPHPHNAIQKSHNEIELRRIFKMKYKTSFEEIHEKPFQRQMANRFDFYRTEYLCMRNHSN